MTTTNSADQTSRAHRGGLWAMHGSAFALGATVWLSAMIFGLYILMFYGAAFFEGNPASWNKGLPGLYVPGRQAATVGIGIHFAAGGIVLILGCIQLLGPLRRRYPAVHRWVGRLYVISAALTALGGLAFIAINGTIGGTVMNVGFGLYGFLTLLAAVETVRHARAGRYDRHRAWALRLYALAIGSWLYRMDYGFWFMLADGAGHTRDFDGWFDRLMAFFFYLPNLLVAEFFIRSKNPIQSTAARLSAAAVLSLATLFILMGTYFYTRYEWGPVILGWMLLLTEVADGT